MAMIRIIRIEGVIRPRVAIMLPGTPPDVKPAYVAIFTPIGPGVDSEIASISAIWA